MPGFKVQRQKKKKAQIISIDMFINSICGVVILKTTHFDSSIVVLTFIDLLYLQVQQRKGQDKQNIYNRF